MEFSGCIEGELDPIELGELVVATEPVEDRPVPVIHRSTHSSSVGPQWQRQPEWAGRELMVGIPFYKDSNPMTTFSLIAIALDLGRERVRFEFEMGDAMVYHARNSLAKKFLESECQWLLMIDDDMVVPIGRQGLRVPLDLPDEYPNEALDLHTVHRLMDSGKTLIGASYVVRNKKSVPITSLNQNLDYIANLTNFTNVVMECEWMGTGCMMIHRSVFEAIQRRFPELAPSELNPLWNYFHPDTDAGEDIAFCRRARAAGHPPHVDCMLQAFHVGRRVYGSHTIPRS